MIRPKFLIFCLDILLAIVAFSLAHLIRFGFVDHTEIFFSGGYLRLLAYLLVLLFFCYFFELFDLRSFYDRKIIKFNTIVVFLASLVALSALFYFIPAVQFGRGLLLITLMLFFVFQYLSRLVMLKFSNNARFANRIVIIGAGHLAYKMYQSLPSDSNVHSFVRFISTSEKEIVVDPDLIIGNISDLDSLIQEYRPQKIVTALEERRGNLPLKEFMHIKLRGVEVVDATAFFEEQKGALLVENMQPSEFVYTHRFRMTPFMRSLKRVNDILFSSIGLILASPLFPVIAVLIKSDSPGPVFFKQLRVGEGEHEFFVYKFRTMAEDAEKKTGAVWAQKNDPRVTRIGKFMRKTRIDEIPQLYNVLKGDMSFIGPRPERMAFVERLKETIPFYSTRHFVKPGVTGWAQVCYPYGASDEDALEKLRYDLYYIKNYSVLLDFKIVIDTIRVVVSGFGGR